MECYPNFTIASMAMNHDHIPTGIVEVLLTYILRNMNKSLNEPQWMQLP